MSKAADRMNAKNERREGKGKGAQPMDKEALRQLRRDRSEK